MKLRNRALGALAGLLSMVSFAGSAIAADHAYTQGAVSVVSSIKIMPGQMDAYMNWLQSGWKKGMEAQKAAGIVLDYHVYATRARTPDDPDVYLVITYKNMAAFDGMQERVDPIMEKAFGSADQQNQANVERGKIRTVLGTELIRELVLK
jgi:hypothetical protein